MHIYISKAYLPAHSFLNILYLLSKMSKVFHHFVILLTFLHRSAKYFFFLAKNYGVSRNVKIDRWCLCLCILGWSICFKFFPWIFFLKTFFEDCQFLNCPNICQKHLEEISNYIRHLGRSPAFLIGDDFVRSNEIVRTKMPIY